jgi:hypothetical protein
MSDDPDKPESGVKTAKPLKIKAEDNPWYLLATLYGVPRRGDDEVQAKNRVAWNRYFAAKLEEETRTKLIEEKRHSAEELTPFSPEQLEDVRRTFAKRCKASGQILALPASDADIDFSYVDFEQGAVFGGYLVRNCFFLNATFSGAAVFARTTFSEAAHFDGAAFSSWASFGGAAFSGGASFDGATFSGNASFGGAAFSGGASFDGAAFSEGALFDGAAFSSWWASFSFGGAIVSGWASFDGATFSGKASFDGAAFSGGASFGGAAFDQESSFVNAEMKGETFFEDAVFKTEPPRFFGAKLHQGTVWRGITWPPKPKNKDKAGTFIDAYACLKLEMDRLKKHEDELNFFALELQSRRIEQGPVWGFPFAIYGVLSDYGRSYLRPLGALIVVAAIGAAAFWYFDARTYGEALGLSAANTLNVFGFRRDFGLAIDTPLAWLIVFSALQTILGVILLFLFGLGVRNKFRMK